MWAQAFLEQARSDWQLWLLIRAQKLPACHALHYLQMTCEKLGKAFLIRGGTISPQLAQQSHAAFKLFLKVASRNPTLQRLLGMSASQLRAHVQGLLPIAEEIERLTPALSHGGPNTEYPWESPNRQINIPVNYNFSVLLALRDPSGINLLKIIDLVQSQFYQLFTKPPHA